MKQGENFMLEFIKREGCNEYAIWCDKMTSFIGELWFCTDSGWHFSLYESDTGVPVDEMKNILAKMEQLTEQTIKEGYFKQQKELVDGNN